MSDETYENVELEEINEEESDSPEKDWKAEALKYKAIADRRKEKLEKVSQPTAQPTVERQEVTPTDILKSPEFTLHRQGYDEREIEFIMKNGGMKALEDQSSIVAIGIKTAREQRAAEDASGQVSDKSGQTEVERKYTPEQMRNMPKDELANLIGFAPER